MPNPFAGSAGYAKLANAFVRPLFSVLPVPAGFAMLTVTGRRSGRRRTLPVRAVRRGNTLYVVSMLGERSDWLRNVRADRRVEVKVDGRRYEGVAQEIVDPGEHEGVRAWVEDVFPADYVDYAGYYWRFPTRRRIRRAHRSWLDEGVFVAIDLLAQER